jgi:hypothetical protein
VEGDVLGVPGTERMSLNPFFALQLFTILDEELYK